MLYLQENNYYCKETLSQINVFTDYCEEWALEIDI